MKSAGKARSNGLYRHIRTSKEIIRNLLNDLLKCKGVISRQGLIYIPSMFILGAIFHETGLIWAQPVADVLSLLLAIGLYFCMSGKGND